MSRPTAQVGEEDTEASGCSAPLPQCVQRKAVSVDSGVRGALHAQRFALHPSHLKSCCDCYESQRSKSSSSYLMVPLPFEDIDLPDGHPLSSLRSCSEFQRHSYSGFRIRKGSPKRTKKKTFLSTLKRMVLGNSTTSSKVRCDDEERSYLVKSFTSRTRPTFDSFEERAATGAVGFVGDRENSSTDDDDVGLRDDEPRKESNDSLCLPTSSVIMRQMPRSRYAPARDDSIMAETNATFDILFGYRSKTPPKEPKEIELKILRSIEVEHYDPPCPSSESFGFPRGEDADSLASRGGSMWSQNSLSQSTETSSDPQVSPSRASREAQETNDSERSTESDLRFLQNLLTLGMHPWAHVDSIFARFYSAATRAVSADNQQLYVLLRLQPFSYSSYMRGMLWSGASSLSFNTYSFYRMICAPTVDLSMISSFHRNAYAIIRLYLAAHFVLNFIQLPGRIVLHFRCWECSRAVDVEVALVCLRKLLESPLWKFNRATGTLQDLLSISSVILAEVYLRLTPSDDPLCDAVTAVSATVLLSLCIRLFVAVVLSISHSDPHTVSEARKRGLPRMDLEALPTFLFTDLEEVSHRECSICLTEFKLGERLIRLRCDKKHSFHASCIHAWLERQNSCPLCQKLL